MKKSLLRIVVSFASLFALMNAASPSLVAQEQGGEIRGTVSEAGRSDLLIGANVFVVGTSLGASTNVDGQYSIKHVPPGTYTVRARYVGYKEQSSEVRVSVGETATLDFALAPSAVQMNEVVVTGQGAAIEKRRLASTVESISSKDVELSPVNSIDALLQGRVPGLSSFSPSGLPGTGARLQTRGIKSVALASTPVIYVDGVRVDNNDNFRLANATGGQVSSSLSDLVTGEIDHIEVIKGGASSTLYGSEAANGVIQIFTKKGIPGDARWQFNATSGFDAPENKFTTEQFTKDKFYKTGAYQGYSTSVSGGTDRFTYNVSGKMYDDRGIVTLDRLYEKQYNIATGMRAILNSTTDVELSSSYTRTQYGRIFNDNSTVAPLSALELEGNFRRADQRGGNKDSLLAIFMEPTEDEFSNRFISTVNVNYAPVEGWKNKFTLGVDYRKSEDRQFIPIAAELIFGTGGSGLSTAHREYLTLTMSYAGSYVLPQLGPVSQTVSFGLQGFRVEDREIFATGTAFQIPGTTVFNNASDITAGESNRQLFNGGAYAQDQIGLLDHVFVDAGVRVDGNSAFGKDVGLQVYPKAGIAYNISDEDYYPGMLKPYLGSMKLRFSWGQTGNFPSPFVRDRTYTSAVFLSEAALTFNNPGDQTLKPEKTSSIDAGFDAGLLDDRLSIEFNYFRQVTKDALFFVATDPASGFGNQQRNVGEIENKGVEISARALVLNYENFELNLRASFATLNNVVTSLGGSPPFTIAGFSFAPQRVEQGYPVGVFRVDVPRLESDGTYKGNFDVVLMGTPTPKQTGSFGLDMTIYKDLTITGLMEFALGNSVLNQGLSRRIVNSQSGNVLYPDAFAKLPPSTNPALPYTRNTASSILVEPGDWFKIREIALRYRLPRLFFRGLSIVASMRNVAVFGTKTYDADPELSFIRAAGNLEVGAIVGANPSPPKQVRLGLDVSL